MITPYYDRDGITIYCGDNAEVMSQLDAASIDLTVTSPPYDNLRTYNGFTWDFEAVAGQLWRVTAKGGVVVWVVGDATVNGSETGTSFRQALGFMGLGFSLHDTMIYKTTKPPLTHNRYEQEFEYMFVFSKSSPSSFNPIKIDSVNSGDKVKTSSFRQDWTGRQEKAHKNGFVSEKRIKGNVWDIKSGFMKGTLDNVFSHPATFPEALARDHITSWSNPGDIVLDPFLGSGTTLKMAQMLTRRAIGVEISEEYCRLAVERLRQPTFFSLAAPVHTNGNGKPVQAALLAEAHNAIT
jgi:DNA modification methylase